MNFTNIDSLYIFIFWFSFTFFQAQVNWCLWEWIIYETCKYDSIHVTTYIYRYFYPWDFYGHVFMINKHFNLFLVVKNFHLNLHHLLSPRNSITPLVRILLTEIRMIIHWILVPRITTPSNMCIRVPVNFTWPRSLKKPPIIAGRVFTIPQTTGCYRPKVKQPESTLKNSVL